jgi:hypothetical protein
MESPEDTSPDPSIAAGREENLGGRSWLLALLACALLASLVLMRTLGTDGKHFIRSLMCIAPAATFSLIGILILARIYWMLARRGSSDTADAVYAIIYAFPITILALETFAGLTELLWSRGLLFSTSALHPDMWTTERFYAWHLTNAIPVLDVPKTLGWNRPVTFTGYWSGVLLLVFKIVLLLPLLGIITASYQLLRDRQINQTRKLEKRYPQHHYRSSPYLLPIHLLLPGAVLMIGPVIAYIILRFLVSDSSPINRWLVFNSPVTWAWDAIQILGIACILLQVARAHFIQNLSTKVVYAMGGMQSSALVVMRRIRSLILATLAACAVTIALPASGVVHAVPALQQGDDVAATIEWYSWHLADTIPFIEAPQSLNWSLQFEFVDAWSRVLLLILKVDLVLILFLPVIFLLELYKEGKEGTEARG